MGLPGPDFVGQLGMVQEEGGLYGAGSNGGRQPFSLASRLSQQALSEIKDRWGYVPTSSDWNRFGILALVLAGQLTTGTTASLVGGGASMTSFYQVNSRFASDCMCAACVLLQA
jgi:hypothetical protein